mgnify:FL=1
MVKHNDNWTEYEDGIVLSNINFTSVDIEKIMKDDPRCKNRTASAIRNRINKINKKNSIKCNEPKKQNEKSKMAYEINETNVYNIETIDSQKDEINSLKTQKYLADNEIQSLKTDLNSALDKIDSLNKELLLLSKIKDGKVIMIPSYLINIVFSCIFINSFFHYFM